MIAFYSGETCLGCMAMAMADCVRHSLLAEHEASSMCRPRTALATGLRSDHGHANFESSDTDRARGAR